ncbi:hypothetical protein EJB05_56292, partial [Eragrostis curvula]
MAARVVILGLMIHALLLAAPTANSEPRGFRATLIRREKAINYPRAAQQSYDRLSTLAARLDAAAGGTSTQTPLRADSAGGYDMEVSIGTPPQQLTAQADTGSDLVWAKCAPCTSCTPPGSPFHPMQSSSFSKMPCSDRLCMALESQNQPRCVSGDSECDYVYPYGSGDHDTEGYMGTETFTLGSDAVQGIGFGCTTRSNGNYGTGSGLVGLGRGPLSLVSQLSVGAFSYCLNPDTSMASPLLFGSMATFSGDGVQSTRLLESNDTFYRVNLKSITVGSTTTPVTGTDGVLFDSGTTFTMLTEPAYTAARTAIQTQTTSLPPAADSSRLGPCFQASDDDITNAVPSMVLHFDGADMMLPVTNYFAEVGNGVVCWVVQPSSSLSIIGNIMQTNYHIQYDLDQKMLSFQPANCNSM